MKIHFLNIVLPLGLLLAGSGMIVTGTGCDTNGNISKDTSLSNHLDRTQQKFDSVIDTAGAKVRKQTDKIGKVFGDGINKDSAFAADAVAMNAEMLRMLKQGASKGKNANLKTDAALMIRWHQQLEKYLRDYGRKKKYPLPANPEVKSRDLDELNQGAAGLEWDNTWASVLMRKHDNDIRSYEDASGRTEDATLKYLVDNSLPTLKEHQAMIRVLRDNL